MVEAHFRIVGTDGLYESIGRHKQSIFNVLLHWFLPRKRRAPSITFRRDDSRKSSLDFSLSEGKVFLETIGPAEAIRAANGVRIARRWSSTPWPWPRRSRACSHRSQHRSISNCLSCPPSAGHWHLPCSHGSMGRCWHAPGSERSDRDIVIGVYARQRQPRTPSQRVFSTFTSGVGFIALWAEIAQVAMRTARSTKASVSGRSASIRGTLSIRHRH